MEDNFYYVVHQDFSTLRFPHELKNSIIPHRDLVYLSKNILISDVITSYPSISHIWNGFIVDGKRMYFYINREPVTLHKISLYIMKNIAKEKRPIVAALCTQSVFALIYEKLQNLVSKEDKYVGEIGQHIPLYAMHVTISVTPSLIVLHIHKRLRIFEFQNNSDDTTLDIIDISIDIQLQNHPQYVHQPIPEDVCVQLKYPSHNL